MMRAHLAAAALAFGLCCGSQSHAVTLNPEGHGQALIYPYYTVRATDGNPFNTLITVVNHDSRAKAVRVRFREGRNGRQVANFNLYLSPNDAWAAAIVPTELGARLITRDRSCTSPGMFALPPPGPTDPNQVGELQFSDAAYSGANADGGGEGPHRTREGYVEMIEMATLTGGSDAAVAHSPSGAPPDCSLAESRTFVPSVGPPTGGLSGTVTLINVASGLDFTFNAEALDGLAKAPFYRPDNDPYPDFDSLEVTPESHLTWRGNQYRLRWARAVDAVSSVLMRWEVFNELVRDANTQSATEWVLTFPTRRFYVTPGAATAPFSPGCEDLAVTALNREELRAQQTEICQPDFGCGARPRTCYVANVVTMRSPAQPFPPSVLGSFNNNDGPHPIASSQIISGWAVTGFVGPGPGAGLRALPDSTVRDMRTEALTTGPLVLRGLPLVGFMARTFLNGTLTCSSSACQGNYGGSFAHRYRRFINTP